MVNLYDNSDYITSLSKRFMTESQKARESGLGALAERGVLNSGAVSTLEQQIQDAFNQRLLEVIPQEMFRSQQFQEQIRQFNEQMAENRARNTMASSAQQQQLGEQQRQFNVGQQFREKELSQQEKLVNAQLEAKRKADEEWWKPLLGGAAGAFGGTLAGGLASNLASKWVPSAMDTYFSSLSNPITQTAAQTYVPQGYTLPTYMSAYSKFVSQVPQYEAPPLQLNPMTQYYTNYRPSSYMQPSNIRYNNVPDNNTLSIEEYLRNKPQNNYQYIVQ